MKYAPVLTRALVFGAIATGALALVGSLVGLLVAGLGGLASALVGAGVTAVFMGVTTVSVVLADRATRRSPSSARYFAIILGMWLLKFILFAAILVAVSGQPWLSPYVFFGAMVVAVIGSIVVDFIALNGARVPYVGDVALPGDPAPAARVAGERE